jgi:hypothetical protein
MRILKTHLLAAAGLTASLAVGCIPSFQAEPGDGGPDASMSDAPMSDAPTEAAARDAGPGDATMDGPHESDAGDAGSDGDGACGSGQVLCDGGCTSGACGCPAGYVACTTSCPTGVSCIKPVAIAAGGSHMCALLSTGMVECWGGNQAGVVGNGAESSPFLTPIPVTGVSNATAIAAGGTQSCALIGGTWNCWGYDGLGVIGVPGTSCNGGVPCTLTPTPLITGATAFSTGFSSTCAFVSGAVKCLGDPIYGEIGTTVGPDSCSGYMNNCAQSPVTVTSSLLTNVTALSAGLDHSICALTQGGSVVCWGDDTDGQIGPNGGASMCNGGSPCSPTPATVAGVNNATAVSVGNGFACALVQSGAVECWGNNADGELGHAETNSCEFNTFPCSATPLAVTGLTGATAIAAGNSFACALVQGGTVECWGANFSGELGNASVTGTCQGGSTVCTTSPVAVTGVTNAVAIAAGGQFACALLQSGDVKCWGGGALGNGTSGPASTAVSVTW